MLETLNQLLLVSHSAQLHICMLTNLLLTAIQGSEIVKEENELSNELKGKGNICG